MNSVIEKIRSRPEHHRDRIVWICGLIAVALLLIIWAIVGNGRKSTPDQNFFQTFNQGFEEGKNVVPADLTTKP